MYDEMPGFLRWNDAYDFCNITIYIIGSGPPNVERSEHYVVFVNGNHFDSLLPYVWCSPSSQTDQDVHSVSISAINGKPKMGTHRDILHL